MVAVQATSQSLPITSHAEHSVNSSLREKLLEHLFVGELLKTLWRRGRRDIEVLRVEVDRGGYDLALECNGVIRHVQLKSSRRGAKTDAVNIQMQLATKPCGCVIWIIFDDETLELGPFLWFGAEPGQCLPDLGEKIARHSKGNSAGQKLHRPKLREVAKRRFITVHTMAELSDRLFG